MHIEEYRSENPKVHDIPLSSSTKWQMSVHQMADIEHNTARGKQVMVLKGTADILVNKCSHYLAHDGTTRPIDKVMMTRHPATRHDTTPSACLCACTLARLHAYIPSYLHIYNTRPPSAYL